MIYILHIEPPYFHARHYVGWTKDDDVTRRVNKHLRQRGSPLVAAAIAAGRRVQLVAAFEGDRNLERRIKRSNTGRHCPLCKAGYNARAKVHMRELRARRKLASDANV